MLIIDLSQILRGLDETLAIILVEDMLHQVEHHPEGHVVPEQEPLIRIISEIVQVVCEIRDIPFQLYFRINEFRKRPGRVPGAPAVVQHRRKNHGEPVGFRILLEELSPQVRHVTQQPEDNPVVGCALVFEEDEQKRGLPLDFSPVDDVRMLFLELFIHIASIAQLQVPEIDQLHHLFRKIMTEKAFRQLPLLESRLEGRIMRMRRRFFELFLDSAHGGLSFFVAVPYQGSASIHTKIRRKDQRNRSMKKPRRRR